MNRLFIACLLNLVIGHAHALDVFNSPGGPAPNLSITGTSTSCISAGADGLTLTGDCSNKRIGIGTANPVYKLHVSSGGAVFDGTTPSIGVGVNPGTNAPIYGVTATTGTFAASGFQYVSMTSTQTNASTNEIGLYELDLATSTLLNVGDCVEISCGGVGAATATTKRALLRWGGAVNTNGGTIIADTGAVTTNAAHWTVRASVCKNNTNTQVLKEFYATAAGTVGASVPTTTLAATEAAAITIRCSCINGTANNADCLGRAFSVTKFPAP